MSAEPPPVEECEGFEELEHTADIAVRVRGATLEAFFANAARGMMALVGAEADLTRPLRRQIALEAPDVETLLVDWLSELAYFLEAGPAAYVDYDLQTTPTRLSATISGGPVVGLQRHIKAVTYHNLEVKHTSAGGFEATVVFDV